MSAGPAAGGCANPLNHAAALPPLAEIRAELRAVAQKVSSCEAALEGQGAYLGIREPVRGGQQPLLLLHVQQYSGSVKVWTCHAEQQAPGFLCSAKSWL